VSLDGHRDIFVAHPFLILERVRPFRSIPLDQIKGQASPFAQTAKGELQRRIGGNTCVTKPDLGNELRQLAKRSVLLPILYLACLCILGCAEKPIPEGGSPLVINRAAPMVTTISPAGAVAGSPSITLAINGSNFTDDAVVTFGGQTFKPQQLTGSQITVSIPSSSLTQIGTRMVGVTNPAPGGTTYALMPFQVFAPPIPSYQQYSTITPETKSNNPYPGAANPAYGQYPTGSPSGAPPYGQFPGGSPSGVPPYGQMPNGTNTAPQSPSHN